MHPSVEILSAYLDGELTHAEAASIEGHSHTCASCAGTLQRFGALDRELGVIPALACGAARILVSATHDGELDAAAARIARAHLGGCAGCRAEAEGWEALDAALASLPLAAPSARVDAALERFRRAPIRTGRPRGRLPLSPPARWPARAAVAVAIALVVLLGLPQGGPEIATPAPETAYVASVQQSVLDPRTGTLYVLSSQGGAVAALDAATLAPRSVIAVGGRPTALALSAGTSQILVLDAQAKTLTAIDTQDHSVSVATPMAVPGTPTSLGVDGSGKVVVTSIIAEDGGGGAAPSPASSAKPLTGAVTVLDPATRKIETVKQVDVAPRQLVIEPGGKRALLVSSEGTTIVDAATYRPLDRAAGGITAAFSGTSGEFAVLSLRGGAAFVSFSAHAGVPLAGSPRAIASLPDGGYAVLTEERGRGRITALRSDGTVVSAGDAPAGRDLSFDPLSGNLVVIGPAGGSIVALPTVAAAPREARSAPPVAASVPPAASAAPAASIAPRSSPSVSPGPSASPSPSASASPSAEASAPPSSSAPPSASPPVAAVPSVEPASPLLPTGARLLSGNTYLYQPAGSVRSTRVAGDRTRIWMLDASGRLAALHTATGEIFHVASLPKNVRIASILISPGYVYLTDPSAGTLYVFNVRTERLTSHPVPFLPLVIDAVASPDDRLWLVVDGLGLVSFDPRSRRTDVADVGGVRSSAVGVDGIGRVWLAPRDRGTVNVYDPYSGKLSELLLPHDGAITAILVDSKAAVWVGTDTGQIFAIRNSKLETAASVGRAIDRLILGASGDVWYVSRAGGEVTFGPADGSALALHGPLGMTTPVFDALGRAWAQDPVSGAFFVTLPAEGR